MTVKKLFSIIMRQNYIPELRLELGLHCRIKSAAFFQNSCDLVPRPTFSVPSHSNIHSSPRLSAHYHSMGTVESTEVKTNCIERGAKVKSSVTYGGTSGED